MPLPTNPIEIVAWLIELGIVLTEQDKEKIRAAVLADKAAADDVTDRSRAQDAPRETPDE